MNKHIQHLQTVVSAWAHPLPELANKILSDARFAQWPATLDRHHGEPGGLARHTGEVYDIAVNTLHTMNCAEKIDLVTIYFAVLYHDIGKLHDFQLVTPNADGVQMYEKVAHDRLIHHINRSALMWSQDVRQYPEVDAQYHDAVLHCILSHHGRREWGSSVAPGSREAWLVHLADMMSARMDSYDKSSRLGPGQQ